MATLLEITQDILSEMGGDEVNSIFDTEESEAVARIVIKVFDAMSSRDVWPNNKAGTTLVARSDSDFPTHFTLADDVKEMISLYYDKRDASETRKDYQPLKYKYPDDFLRYLNTRDSTAASTQEVTNDDGIVLLIRNDKSPDYYTSFNDKDIICDSFDSDAESNLVSAKVQAIALIQPTLTLADASVIDIPVDATSLLYEESLSRCQLKIKEVNDVKAEQEATRQRRALSRKDWRVNRQQRYPNYGRKV